MQIQQSNSYNSSFQKMGEVGKALGRVGRRMPSPYQNKAGKINNNYLHEVKIAYNSLSDKKDILQKELAHLNEVYRFKIDIVHQKPVFNGKLPFEA